MICSIFSILTVKKGSSWLVPVFSCLKHIHQFFLAGHYPPLPHDVFAPFELKASTAANAMKCEARNGSWLLQRGSATGWMNPAGIIWYLNTKKHRMMIAVGRVHKGVPPWKSLSCGWAASNSTVLFLLGGPQEMAIELDTDMIPSNNPTWKGNALDSPIICSCYRYWNGWWFGAISEAWRTPARTNIYI